MAIMFAVSAAGAVGFIEWLDAIRGPDGSAGIARRAVAFRTVDHFETRFHIEPPV